MGRKRKWLTLALSAAAVGLVGCSTVNENPTKANETVQTESQNSGTGNKAETEHEPVTLTIVHEHSEEAAENMLMYNC